MNEKRTDPKDKEVLTGVNYNGDPRDNLISLEQGPGEKEVEYKPIERKTSEPEIIFILRGTVRISIDRGAAQTVDAGKMIFLPPGSYVCMELEVGCQLVRLRIDPERQEYLFARFSELYKHKKSCESRCFSLEINRWIQIYLDGLVPFLRGFLLNNGYQKYKVYEYICILFGYYDKLELTGFFHSVLGEDTLFRFFILKNLKEVTSVEQLALRANMSRSGFFHKFTRIYGESPTLYLRKNKARQIHCDLINTDITLQSLATLHGFASYEVFSKFVKKMLGDPPREIRKKSRKASLPEF